MRFISVLSIICLLNLSVEVYSAPSSPLYDLVNVTLYYESLCSPSRGFINGQLNKAFQSIGSIFSLTLVPYGNAWQMYTKESGKWQFNCQHGTSECWGNLYHSCLIDTYPRKEDHFPIIQCIMSYNINIQDAARICSNKYNVPSYQIENCMSSNQANLKMHALADMTERAKIGYTPWIVIDSQHTTEIQNKAGNNLIEYVCSLYKGPNKPRACFNKKTELN